MFWKVDLNELYRVYLQFY